MNSNYESNNMTATSLEALIAANGQAMEEIDRTPYAPILYALPEEWLRADRTLRQQAADFQPTLYRMIRPLATAEQIFQMQDEQIRLFQTEKQEMLRSIRSTLQQDGSVREQNFSRTSDLLSENRKAILQLVERLENRIRKIVIYTAVSSAALSVLVCVALRLLVG